MELKACTIPNSSSTMRMPSRMLSPEEIKKITDAVNARFPCKTGKRSKPKHRVRALLCPVISKHFYNIRNSQVEPKKVRCDASYLGFRPTISGRYLESISMTRQILKIGKGPWNDVDLDNYGDCRNIKSKHAVIFYDEFSETFELINYSTRGTYVNSKLFSIDTSIYFSGEPCGTERFHSIVEVRKKTNKWTFRMATIESGVRSPCSCQPEETFLGWELPAILTHGCLLRFGCISFVFSIIQNN